MKAIHSYVVIGAALAAAVAFAWAGQNVQDANAQNTINQTQNQADQLDRTNNLQDSATQTQNQVRTDTLPRTSRTMKHLKASELSGMDVRGMSGDDAIGEISDVVIDHDGKVKYVAMSFGGFLGLGDKLFAVPFEAIEFVREADDADERYARIDVTEETLKNKPGFDQDNWPDEADQSFLRQGTPRTARQNDRPIPPAGDSQVPR